MRFSGLFREVYLQRIPKVHLWDLSVRTLLDDRYEDAVLEAEMKAEGPEGSRAVLALKDGDAVIAGCEGVLSGGKLSAAIPVKHPRKWSAEVPALYDLEILMLNPEGKTEEEIHQPVGFRRFEMKDGLMLLNGKRIVFKGVNRHDFCGETGRAVTAEKIRRDLIMMKRYNLNAVRTSHYPNSSLVYALCDELGLYVIDECNMETHGVWDRVARGELTQPESLPGDRREYLPMMLDRVHSMVERDKNHPCILLWSCGNESYGGQVILEMSNEMRRMDETRLVHYEGVSYEGREGCPMETTDVYSQMYTPLSRVKQWLEKYTDKPFILCEYTHSMGNSNGAMHWYTRYAYEEPRYQGGFIWDFIDQSIRGKNRYGRTVYRYGGDFDDRPNDGDFSGNGIFFGDGTPTPKLQEVKYNYRSIEAEIDRTGLLIRNRHLFRNTEAFDCRVTLMRNGKEILRTGMKTAVAPMTEERYPLPFRIPEEGGEYTVTVSFRLKEDTDWAPAGHEIAWDQGTWTEPERQEPGLIPPPLRVVKGSVNVGVFGEGFTAMFSRETGTLISYTVCGREMLKTPPRPVFWRAPTDNDNGNGMPARYARWKTADLYAAPLGRSKALASGKEAPEIRENADGSVSFRTTWELPGEAGETCEMTITVMPGGRVGVTLAYEPAKGRAEMPLFGVSFKMDADFDQVRYYGLGPEENYIDRREGARLGIWHFNAAENLTPYLLPQESGNRTGVRWAEVTDSRGRGLRFLGQEMEFNALPWTAHEIENAAHGDELPAPKYTVIRAALRQMGVGGDDSWGARTHDEYLVKTEGKLTFSFCWELKV